MALLDLGRFRAAPVHAAAIPDDLPAIACPGLPSLEAPAFGIRFGVLIEEPLGKAMAGAFSEIFDIDLAGRPAMITVRGRRNERDGRLHRYRLHGRLSQYGIVP